MKLFSAFTKRYLVSQSLNNTSIKNSGLEKSTQEMQKRINALVNSSEYEELLKKREEEYTHNSKALEDVVNSTEEKFTTFSIY